MTIARGSNVKNLALYPPAQPSLTIIKIRKQPVTYLTQNIRSPLTAADSLEFKKQTKYDIINTYINQLDVVSNLKYHMIEAALDNEIEEDPLKYIIDQTIPTTTIYNSKPIEIEPEKVLNINKNLTDDQW